MTVPAVQSQRAALDHQQARMYDECLVLAKSSLVRADLRGKPDDIYAIANTIAKMGVEPTLYTVNQCFVVHGVVGIMGQLLIGVADRRGFDLDIVERTPQQATVVLRRRSDGRETRITYTMAEAGKSATGDVWAKYPVDMLVWRAVRRAMRFGAPSIVAGLPPEDYETDTVAAAPDEPPPEAIEAVKADGRRVLRLRAQIDALPETARDELRAAWKAAGIPAVDHEYFHGFVDQAEDLVDAITAQALAAADTITQAGQGEEAAGGTGHASTAGVHPERGEAHGPEHTVSSPQPSRAHREEGPPGRASEVDSPPAGPLSQPPLYAPDDPGRPFGDD